MQFETLGDRMKFYEKLSVPTYLMPRVPAFARIDGKNFHSFTRDLNRPFDENFVTLMRLTTEYLVKTTNARMGYTQSDEITLTWLADEPNSEIFFDGKIQKMISVLASMTSVYFNKQLQNYLPHKVLEYPLFDCRVWTVPSIEEGANVFVWRELDATRNSIQMAARAYFSHRECENKSCNQLQEMLFKEKKINWNDYPTFFKKGTYIQNVKVPESFVDEPLFRRLVKPVHLPVITTIENRAEVIYSGATPITKQLNNT